MTDHDAATDSPQQLLDQLHESGIFALDDRTLPTAVDRAARAREINPQLTRIRHRARAAIQQRPQDSEPYELLDSLVQDLEVALRAFITDPDARIPRYGTVIFEKEGRWHIGTQNQAQDWALQRHAQAVELKRKALDMALDDTREKLKVTQRDIYRHDETGRGIRLGVAGALLIVAGVVGYGLTRLTVVLGGVGIGLLLLVLAVILFVRWQQRERVLNARFDTLQQRGRQQVKQQQMLQERQAQIAQRRDQLQLR